jgi:hypothetical protein
MSDTRNHRTPWKALFAASMVLTAAGCLLLLWSVVAQVGARGTVIGGFVIVLGSLLARMNFRAHRYGLLPSPTTTLPIVGVGACALLWIAITSGLLRP